MAMYTTDAIAKKTKDSKYEKIQIQRGSTSDMDVDVDMKFSGVCHSDVAMANNEWGFSSYPFVPGHESVGIVSKVHRPQA